MKAWTAALSGAPSAPPIMTRVVHRISEPGWISFVASRAACDMSTRGPRPTPVASRSGSLTSSVRRTKFVSPMRMTSPSLRLRRANSASSTAAPNIPSRSPSASSSDMGGAKTAWPIRGHDGSTALISISAASPLAALAMPRAVATVDSEPCASRKRCSSAERRRWMSANEASPPRITRPSRPMPSLSARARLSTPDDRRHAKRDAEKKDAQAREPAAQIAQGEA